MNTTRIMAAVLIIGWSLASKTAQGQQARISRSELTRSDLGDSVHEVIQVRVDFGPGAAFPRHSHPGVEVAHVLKGSLTYQFDGRPPVTLKAGDSLFIPAGTIHSAS